MQSSLVVLNFNSAGEREREREGRYPNTEREVCIKQKQTEIDRSRYVIYSETGTGRDNIERERARKAEK
jgi:hypothetical protein